MKVINGKADLIADEWDVTPGYIYNIQTGRETDPFAKFQAFFAACVRAGCDVSPWLNRLEVIKAKYPAREPLSVETETTNSLKESTDFFAATIEGKSYTERLSELDQSMKQDEITKKALIKAIADENENGRRAFSVREFAGGKR